MNKTMWWGYLHANGKIQVKQWFGDHKDYTEDCEGNDFVQRVVKPFEAASREEAIEIIAKELSVTTCTQPGGEESTAIASQGVKWADSITADPMGDIKRLVTEMEEGPDFYGKQALLDHIGSIVKDLKQEHNNTTITKKEPL